MNLRSALLLAVVAAASACANTPETATAARDEIRCQKYTPTGTRLPQTRCATAEQLEREREAAQEFIKQRTQQTTTGGSN